MACKDSVACTSCKIENLQCGVIKIKKSDKECTSLYFVLLHRFEKRLTSITVSKLKAVPFQSINSPVWPPVNNLLPSGVHFTTVMGFFDFPIDWWRWRTGMVSAGECIRAAGGSVYEVISREYFSFSAVRGRNTVRRLYSSHLVVQTPSCDLPCTVVVEFASIVPLTNHNRLPVLLTVSL
jgi:hypothetical protein